MQHVRENLSFIFTCHRRYCSLWNLAYCEFQSNSYNFYSLCYIIKDHCDIFAKEIHIADLFLFCIESLISNYADDNSPFSCENDDTVILNLTKESKF